MFMKVPNMIPQAKLLMLILLMISGIYSFTQENKGKIEVIVLDLDTRDSIPFAQVKIKKDKELINAELATKGVYVFNEIPKGEYKMEVSATGFQTIKGKSVFVRANATTTVKIELKRMPLVVMEAEVEDVRNESKIHGSVGKKRFKSNGYAPSYANSGYQDSNHNTESYSPINENGFKSSVINPLSTLSVDVDAASYSNVRRFIVNGNKPPVDAVRVEEMINYFNYDYPNPTDEHPFSITTEVGACPWNEETNLIHIGLQGERIESDDLPPSNLVFLLDVSGSMNSANKLPLLKKSFQLLVNELDESDKIAIVVYAGASGLVLASTSADQKTLILESLDGLSAGGSTAGGEGIELAYKVAEENFLEGGNNRVILATDGDFNIGMSSDGAMQRLIEEKRETGVFLTCLGFGMGNYKDSKLEVLADKGNGNYAYIDNLFEAKKVLVTEIGATLLTIAKDVKIQVEFNPNVVESYRLVGYENRLLNEEDFNDDEKDAGEIGAGHSVTALYEVVMKSSEADSLNPEIDPLRYQTIQYDDAAFGAEMFTVKFRYKEPNGEISKLIERNVKNKVSKNKNLSMDFFFAAAVAEFGMVLRNSKFKAKADFDHISNLAIENRGKDEYGYRSEFIRLVGLAKNIYEPVKK